MSHDRAFTIPTKLDRYRNGIPSILTLSFRSISTTNDCAIASNCLARCMNAGPVAAWCRGTALCGFPLFIPRVALSQHPRTSQQVRTGARENRSGRDQWRASFGLPHPLGEVRFDPDHGSTVRECRAVACLKVTFRRQPVGEQDVVRGQFDMPISHFINRIACDGPPVNQVTNRNERAHAVVVHVVDRMVGRKQQIASRLAGTKRAGADADGVNVLRPVMPRASATCRWPIQVTGASPPKRRKRRGRRCAIARPRYRLRWCGSACPVQRQWRGEGGDERVADRAEGLAAG